MPERTDDTTVQVLVTRNQFAPVFGNEPYRVTVPETTPINSTIISVTATDRDLRVSDTAAVSKSLSLLHVRQEAQACLPARDVTASLLSASRPFYVINIYKRRSSGLFTSNNSCYKTTNVSLVKKNSYLFVVQAGL